MVRSSLPLTSASFRYATALADRPPEILGVNPFDKDPAWPRFKGSAEALVPPVYRGEEWKRMYMLRAAIGDSEVQSGLAQDILAAYYEVSLIDLQSDD